MLNLPTKPRITAEVTRGDYEIIALKLRVRRNWQKMSLEERQIALLESATQLETYAQQMRDEAEMLSERIAH